MTRPFIIAIDGPAASGKGTLARKIAAHYGLAHLDTGLTYRAVAQKMLQQGVSLKDEAQAANLACQLDLAQLDMADLSAHEYGEVASKIAVFPQLRRELVGAQQRFAQKGRGAVLDGRDIGTVVVPQADVKFYVTATRDVRARRRLAEIIAKGGIGDLQAILADLAKRDARDINREQGALRQAPDACLLETTKLTIEAAFAVACRLIDKKITCHCDSETNA